MSNLISNYTPDNSSLGYDPNIIQSYFDSLLGDMKNITKQQDENIEVTRWNTYYYKKYKIQNKVLLFIIFTCLVIIIITLIKNSFPYLDEMAYSVIIGIIVGLGFVYLSYAIWGIYMKDDMNFDEIDYGVYSGPVGKKVPRWPTHESNSYPDISLNFDRSLNCMIPSDADLKKIANSNFFKQLFY